MCWGDRRWAGWSCGFLSLRCLRSRLLSETAVPVPPASPVDGDLVECLRRKELPKLLSRLFSCRLWCRLPLRQQQQHFQIETRKKRNQTKKSHPSHVGEVKQKGRGFAFENLASRIVVNILLLFVYPIRIDLGHISWRHQHFYIWFHSFYQLPFQNGKTWTAKIFLRLRNPVAPMMNGGSQWRQTDNVRLVCVIEKKKRTKSNNHNTIHKSDKIW